MRLPTTLPALQRACCILLFASCVLAVPKINLSGNDGEEDSDKYVDEEIPKNHRKQIEDEVDLDDLFDAERIRDEQLPILPPIILLDFVNGTGNTSSNGTLEGDEKTKRTVDSSFGYGYDRNNFFSGKHNFYLPGGTGATSVSIEESISFEPKTLTEIEKPIQENSDAEIAQEEQKTRKPLNEKMPEPLPLQNARDPLPLYPPYPMFGQRTKLHKTSSSAESHLRPQTKYTNSYGGTRGSEAYNKPLATYSSVKPTNPQAASFSNAANIQGYVRPMTSSYVTNHVSDVYGSGSNKKSSYNLQSGAVGSETPVSSQNLANFPRYTVENGIKYEHKIVWKYPDGRVSETAPMSYTNMHSEYSNSAGSFRPSAPYQPRPAKPQHTVPPGSTSYNQYTAAAQNNIYSQKPIQFPSDQEHPGHNRHKATSGFVSSSTINNSPVRQNNPAGSYNYQGYQSPYGLKQHAKVRPTSSNQYDQYSAYSNSYRPASAYGMNSPGSEYSYPGASQSTGNLFMSDGQINKQVLSKYSPEAQKYLSKVFANGKTTASKNQYQQHDQFKNYAKTDYSSLLNYNPSISQYIKDPSSILKAQPTFIQSGDSLVPVIILRVDGAPPVSTQASNSNINLKSLLRQYLTQYANNVSKASQSANYDLGSNFDSSETSPSQSNPVQDLKELTETLASLRQRGYQDPDFASNSSPEYTQSSQLTRQQNSGQEYTTTGYNGYYQTSYLEQQVKKPEKVKSVQIIEDPKYTSYKVNN